MNNDTIERIWKYIDPHDDMYFPVLMSLSTDDLQTLYSRSDLEYEIKIDITRPLERAKRSDDYKKELIEKKTVRNEATSVLLKQYLDTKSKKVVTARKELQRRFLYLSYNEQMTFARGMLSRGKNDRVWCYDILRKWWSDELYDDVLKIWENFHEERCSWLLTMYFPSEILHREYDELGKIDSCYYHLCKRLATEGEQHIDKERLRTLVPPRQYFEIIALCHGSLTDAEAKLMIFTRIADIIRFIVLHDLHLEDKNNPYKLGGFTSLAEFEDVLVKLCKIGLYETADSIIKYDKDIYRQFCSENYSLKPSQQLSLFMEFYAEHFPSEYQDLIEDVLAKDTTNKKVLHAPLHNRWQAKDPDYNGKRGILESPAVMELIDKLNLRLVGPEDNEADVNLSSAPF